MTTSAEVAAAWNTAIWQHATIQAITNKIFDFDLIEVESESETKRMSFGQELNFIQCLVVRAHRYGETADALGLVANYDFTVQVVHCRQVDLANTGANWGHLRNLFDTLFPLVVSELGSTWSGTVDLWRPQEGPPRIDQISIDETPCWRGLYEYRATKRVTI